MNTARERSLIDANELGEDPENGLFSIRRLRFRGGIYLLAPIGPADPRRICELEGAPEEARDFAAGRWVVGVSVAQDGAPESPLGFYAVAHSGTPGLLDDTLIFVSPRARGRHLSHLLVYGVYLALLARGGDFRLCEVIDHPRLRLHTRCGFAPPVRKLVDGRVEVGPFDLHAVLSRLESEDEIEELDPA